MSVGSKNYETNPTEDAFFRMSPDRESLRLRNDNILDEEVLPSRGYIQKALDLDVMPEIINNSPSRMNLLKIIEQKNVSMRNDEPRKVISCQEFPKSI